MLENQLVKTIYPTVSMCFKKCRLYVLNYLLNNLHLLKIQNFTKITTK